MSLNQLAYASLRTRRGFIFRPVSRISCVAAIVAAIFAPAYAAVKGHDSLRILDTAGIPPVPDSLRVSMQRFQNSRSATLQDWMPDGRGIFVLTRFAESNQLHTVATPGGARRQVTFLEEPVIGATVCPDPARRSILFLQDSGGNEEFQIFRLDIDSMRISRITDGRGQNSGIVWSNRGDRFAYVSSRRNGRDFDLYVRDMDRPGDAKMVLSRGGAWSANDWSPDDNRLLISQYYSRTRSYLYTLDLRSGALTPLSDTTDTVSQESGAWSRDGRGIFLTSDKNTDLRCLRYRDIETGRERVLTGGIRWDIREIALSRDRRRLAFTTNEHAFSQVYMMDAGTFSYRPIPGLPRAVIFGLRFDPSGSRLGVTMNLPQQPEDAYAIRMKDFAIQRWTESEVGEIDPRTLVTPSIVHYPTFDSVDGTPRMIPCFVYLPARPTARVPVLISIHGGPESQHWPYFTPITQFLVNELGIAVLAPNVRGSGGYGKRYLNLDNGLRREDAVRDIGALIDWIATQQNLDSSRVAVMGGSYGGYLALASMVHYGKRLRVGIDQYGISNFLTFLENTALYRRDLRRVEYGDERDPAMREFLARISPLTSARKIDKPLLIIQGANDPRVPRGESEQIARAVRGNGSTAWLLLAGDEGHGFRKKSNRDNQDLAIAFFLRKFLTANCGVGPR